MVCRWLSSSIHRFGKQTLTAWRWYFMDYVIYMLSVCLFACVSVCLCGLCVPAFSQWNFGWHRSSPIFSHSLVVVHSPAEFIRYLSLDCGFLWQYKHSVTLAQPILTAHNWFHVFSTIRRKPSIIPHFSFSFHSSNRTKLEQSHSIRLLTFWLVGLCCPSSIRLRSVNSYRTNTFSKRLNVSKNNRNVDQS